MSKISLASGIRMAGFVTITGYTGIRDKNEMISYHQKKKVAPKGITLFDDHNLVVNTGLKTFAHLLGNDASAQAVRYIAFGSGGGSGGSFNAPTVSDYKLVTEEFREPVAYTFNDGAPEFSVTFTAAALADEHPDVLSISEVGLMTKSVQGNPTADTMDLVARVTFPEIFFSSSAPVNMGLVVDWRIVMDSIS